MFCNIHKSLETFISMSYMYKFPKTSAKIFINVLGVQLCSRRFFFTKFEALFLKSDYLFIIQGIVRC